LLLIIKSLIYGAKSKKKKKMPRMLKTFTQKSDSDCIIHSIGLSINPSTNPIVYLSIYLSIYLFICLLYMYIYELCTANTVDTIKT